MTVKTAAIEIKLVDNVSKPARTVAEALKDAERRMKDTTRAMSNTGATDRFTKSLAGMKLSARDVATVSDAWKTYARTAGLAANSANWTKAQAADVKAWERSTISSLRAVGRERIAFAKEMRRAESVLKPSAAATAAATPFVPLARQPTAGDAVRAGGVAGLASRGFGKLGALAAGALTAGAVVEAANSAQTRAADVNRRMLRTGITGDADNPEIAAGKATLRKLAGEMALQFDTVQKGMDAVVASGRSFGDALRMMPSISATAQASGAEVEDIANSSTALLDHMGIKIEGLQRAQDALAAGGKLGKFELKDAARYLPSMLPAVKAMGLSGQAGLEKLTAMLQVIREGTGTAEEAASSAANIFAKMESEETAKKFKKFGVNLRAEMEKARKEGKDLLTTFVELTQKATKGDLSKIPQLFTDMEFARGMRALLAKWDKVGELQKQIHASAGTVSQDLKRVTSDSQASIDRLAEAKDRAMSSAGETLLSLASGRIALLTKELNAIADRIDEFNETQRKRGLGAAVGDAAKDVAKAFLGENIYRTIPGTATQAQIEGDTLRRQADLRRAITLRQTQGHRGGPTEAQLQAELDHVDEVARRIHQTRGEAARVYAETTGKLTNAKAQAALRGMLTGGVGARAFSAGAGVTPDMLPHGVNAFPMRLDMGTKASRQKPRRARGAQEATFYGGPDLPPLARAPTPPDAPARSGGMFPTGGLRGAAKAKAAEIAVEPKVDTTQIDAAGQKADEAKAKVEGLNVTAKPTVDSSDVDALNAKIDKARAGIRALGGEIGAVAAKGASLGTGLSPLARGANTSFRATTAAEN